MLSKYFWPKCTKEKIKSPEPSVNAAFWQHGGGIS